MQMMAMGSGESIQKVIAVDPKGVVESREKEKVALQELNDRFAAYIERVRFLEADNKRLQSIITELTAKFNSLDAALRVIYEEELAAARTALDKTTAAKGAAELRAFNAEAKLKEIMELYTAESAAHVVTKESIPSLEKMISERDSQIDFLTKNLTAVEMELARLKAQIATLQKELAAAKQGGDAEVVARVELESLLTTKDDEIAFLTNMYEEKVKALMTIDLGSDAFASLSPTSWLSLSATSAANTKPSWRPPELRTPMPGTRPSSTKSWPPPREQPAICRLPRKRSALPSSNTKLSMLS